MRLITLLSALVEYLGLSLEKDITQSNFDNTSFWESYEGVSYIVQVKKDGQHILSVHNVFWNESATKKFDGTIKGILEAFDSIEDSDFVKN